MTTSWLDLPRDTWFMIFELLDKNLFDVVTFSATCSTFRSIALSADPKNTYRLSRPLLLVPPGDATSVNHDLFSLADRKRAYEFRIPELQNHMFCYGSSFDGWLFTVDLNSAECRLLNPVTRVNISHPPLPLCSYASSIYFPETVIRRWYIKKAIIIEDPSKPKTFLVMLIFKKNLVLSFCRPGDIDWTDLSKYGDGFQDVIGHMGKFYAVNVYGELLSWDHCGTKYAVRTIISPIESRRTIRHLVNSRDGTELLMACEGIQQTFSVFRVDMEKRKFIKLQRLGDDRAFFLSMHCAFCVSTIGCPHFFANHIYCYTYNGTGDCREYAVYAYDLDDITLRILRTRKINKRILGKRIYNSAVVREVECIWFMPRTNKYEHITTTKDNNINTKKRKQ